MVENITSTQSYIYGRSFETNAAQDFFGADGLSFNDVVDAVNPLKNLPIVSNIFKAATGETSSAGSQMIGGALYGGVVGFLVSFLNSSFEAGTGKNMVETAYAELSTQPQIQNVAKSLEEEVPAAETKNANEKYQRRLESVAQSSVTISI